MSHHVPWCGCDPNHLGTHERGKTTGCKFNDDPQERLTRDTETWLNSTEATVHTAAALLRRWLDLDG